MLNFFIKLIASGFFLSYPLYFLFKKQKSKGTGLIGSLIGFLLWIVLEPTIFFLVSLFLLIIAIPICYFSEKIYKNKDDPRIIIDEVIGYCVCVLGLKKNFLLGIIALFIFRIFDILKIPSKKIEKLPYGVGIVIDDVLAGVGTNILMRLFL